MKVPYFAPYRDTCQIFHLCVAQFTLVVHKQIVFMVNYINAESL